MSSAPQVFTVEECERLFIAPKTVATRITWKAINPNTLHFQAKVVTNEGRGLDLHGCWQKVGRHGETRWGFSLTYHGNCVRSFDMAWKHKNPGGKWVRGPHKHKFSASRIPRFAYKPDPPISVTEPNQSLIDFLVEANIAVPPNFQYFMFQ